MGMVKGIGIGGGGRKVRSSQEGEEGEVQTAMRSGVGQTRAGGANYVVSSTKGLATLCSVMMWAASRRRQEACDPLLS